MQEKLENIIPILFSFYLFAHSHLSDYFLYFLASLFFHEFGHYFVWSCDILDLIFAINVCFNSGSSVLRPAQTCLKMRHSDVSKKLNTKGRTNSKLFFQADVSSKKQTNKFDFTTCRLVSVCFLEESGDTKKTFRIDLTFS